MTENEMQFSLSMRCWVYPFCSLPPSTKKCYRSVATGLECGRCRFRVTDEKKARELQQTYDLRMVKKEKDHYEFLKTQTWKETRHSIFDYDNHKCVVCSREITLNQASIHHVIDFSGSDDLSPANLVTLCSDCHSKLHPVLPKGLWLLGWPNLSKLKTELKRFYENVKIASERNQKRFKAPLEHIMMHICFICTQVDSCKIGKFASNDISINMERFDFAMQKRCHISDIQGGLKTLIVEGRIKEKSEPKMVETKYGLTPLSSAILEDETGEIILNLWGSQIEKVKVGDNVRIVKGYVITYEGHLILNVPKEFGDIITNPKSALSIPFWEVQGNWKGKQLQDTCSCCGTLFSYTYLGGHLRKICPSCSKQNT